MHNKAERIINIVATRHPVGPVPPKGPNPEAVVSDRKSIFLLKYHLCPEEKQDQLIIWIVNSVP